MEPTHSLRPSAGTKTGRVWEIADDLTRRARTRARRQDVVSAYVAEGGNEKTASTQYQQWKSEYEAGPRSLAVTERRVMLQVKEGGRVLLPAELRAALGVSEGDTMAGVIVDGELRLMPRSMALRRARELVRQFVPAGTNLVEALLEERRAEAARESVK
jgi:bifunctional DNA-binding transcriptional regulator/antitoxin component of YhaV-PrlF toxin-antitoxin module